MINSFDSNSDYQFCRDCDTYSVLMYKDKKDINTHCVRCGADSSMHKYVNCNIMKMKRFDKLLRKMSIVTEEYHNLANKLRNDFLELKIYEITPLDVKTKLINMNQIKSSRNYPKVTIIYSLIIGESIKMSFTDKQTYRELFKQYIYATNIIQINYPLILGLIYHEIHKSTLLEPKYHKESTALIASIHGWNSFIYNLNKRKTQEKYVMQLKPNKMKSVCLKDL